MDRRRRRQPVVDFAESSLHLLGYSVPVRERLSLAELRERVFTHENPDWIPYRTSYYTENWGFCLSQRQLDALEDGEYEVYVGTRLEDGHLTYGEALIPGETQDEFLLSTYVCHPALCNDNLSGSSCSPRSAGGWPSGSSATRTGCSSAPGRSARSAGSRETATASAGSGTGWSRRASAIRAG